MSVGRFRVGHSLSASSHPRPLSSCLCHSLLYASAYPVTRLKISRFRPLSLFTLRYHFPRSRCCSIILISWLVPLQWPHSSSRVRRSLTLSMCLFRTRVWSLGSRRRLCWRGMWKRDCLQTCLLTMTGQTQLYSLGKYPPLVIYQVPSLHSGSGHGPTTISLSGARSATRKGQSLRDSLRTRMTLLTLRSLWHSAASRQRSISN